MGAGYHGGFGKTEGESTHNKNINSDKQGKHIIGHKNYITGRSIFFGTVKTAELLIKQYSGTGVIVSQGKERIDFGRVIGYYVDKSTGKQYPTTMGIIHSSKNGSHIVPAKPKKIIRRKPYVLFKKRTIYC